LLWTREARGCGSIASGRHLIVGFCMDSSVDVLDRLRRSAT
jgi:hypothetical protein